MRSTRTAFATLALVGACGIVAAISSFGVLKAAPGDSGTPATGGDKPGSGAIPDHPSKIEYPELDYKVPSKDGMRVTLKNGIVLWWAQDKGVAGLPAIFRLAATVKSTTLFDPAGKEGLASLTATMMREGGTRTGMLGTAETSATRMGARETKLRSRDELNRTLELKAADISSSAGDEFATVSMSCLDGDRAGILELFGEVLLHPAFDGKELERVKDQAHEALRRRNDSPGDIEGREWQRLLMGNHPLARVSTATSLAAITGEDLIAWHNNHYNRPDRLMFHGSGSATAQEVATMLNNIGIGEIGSPDTPTPPLVREVAAVKQVAEPGIYLMNRDQAQAHVRLGHVCYQRDERDIFAVLVLDYILGGGSFSSRITQKVRVENGLSYVSGCRIETPQFWTGAVRAIAQTKNNQAPLAAKLMIDEIKRIREAPVTAEELRTAIEYYKGSFPQSFSTRFTTAQSFARAELNGRPDDWFESWRDRIGSVTADDVQRAAQKYLAPDKLVVFILGRDNEVIAGNVDDADKARVTRLEDLKLPVKRIPLPEPENLTVPVEGKGGK